MTSNNSNSGSGLGGASNAPDWTAIIRIEPTAELSKMDGPGSETRHPLITWRAVFVDENGVSYEENVQMKALWITFEHQTENARIPGWVKYRIRVAGFEQDINETTGVVETKSNETTANLMLTTRAPWKVTSTKVKGKNTVARMVKVEFQYPEKKAGDIVVLEVCVPLTEDSDKGSPLKFAFDWAKRDLAAKRAYNVFLASKN